MKKKRTAQLRYGVASTRRISVSAFSHLRALLALVVCSAAACSMLSGALPAFFRSDAPSNRPERTLTFAERVAYQRAIENVYWRHRIWPRNRGERPDPKPSLDAVMSQTQLEKKVEDYLRKSQAPEDYWQRPITAEQLQAEMDRMAQHTKQPDVLSELFAALGNDPFVIAECLARPALAERLLTSWYAYDERIHGEPKQRAEAELLEHPSIEQMKELSGKYSEIVLFQSDSQDEAGRSAGGSRLNSLQWDENLRKLAAIFGKPDAAKPSAFDNTDVSGRSNNAAADCYEGIPKGKVSLLQEDQDHYYATAVAEKAKDHLKLATVTWSKAPFESWRLWAENQVAEATAAKNASYTLPAILDVGCINDTWAASSMNPPIGRWNHTAVWTGTEMIVWGGEN